MAGLRLYKNTLESCAPELEVRYHWDMVWWMVSIGNGNKEDIISQAQLIDIVNKRLEIGEADETEKLWFLENIIDHQLQKDGKYSKS